MKGEIFELGQNFKIRRQHLKQLKTKKYTMINEIVSALDDLVTISLPEGVRSIEASA